MVDLLGQYHEVHVVVDYFHDTIDAGLFDAPITHQQARRQGGLSTSRHLELD